LALLGCDNLAHFVYLRDIIIVPGRLPPGCGLASVPSLVKPFSLLIGYIITYNNIIVNIARQAFYVKFATFAIIAKIQK